MQSSDTFALVPINSIKAANVLNNIASGLRDQNQLLHARLIEKNYQIEVKSDQIASKERSIAIQSKIIQGKDEIIKAQEKEIRRQKRKSLLFLIGGTGAGAILAILALL